MVRRFLSQMPADSPPRRYPREAMRRISNKIKLFLLLASVCWFICVAAFLPLSTSLGGTAQNGKIEAGRYFLGQHGVYTEVSRTGYVVSAICTGLFGLTPSLTIFVGLLFAARSFAWPHRLAQVSFTIFGLLFCALMGYLWVRQAVRCIAAAIS